MNKQQELEAAHKKILDHSGFSAKDIELAFPIGKLDDAVRIGNGLEYINGAQDGHTTETWKTALVTIFTGMVANYLSTDKSGKSAAIAALPFALATAWHAVAGLSAGPLRNDRYKEIKAAIEYAKTPEWIHRLARENKL